MLVMFIVGLLGSYEGMLQSVTFQLLVDKPFNNAAKARHNTENKVGHYLDRSNHRRRVPCTRQKYWPQ